MKSFAVQLSEIEEKVIAAKGRPYLQEIYDREAANLGYSQTSLLHTLPRIALASIELGRIEGENRARGGAAAPGSVVPPTSSTALLTNPDYLKAKASMDAVYLPPKPPTAATVPLAEFHDTALLQARELDSNKGRRQLEPLGMSEPGESEPAHKQAAYWNLLTATGRSHEASLFWHRRGRNKILS